MYLKEGVTLTLSGGGLRSLASLGVISYLRSKQIKINEISGTSGGAIVALLDFKKYDFAFEKGFEAAKTTINI